MNCSTCRNYFFWGGGVTKSPLFCLYTSLCGWNPRLCLDQGSFFWGISLLKGSTVLFHLCVAKLCT